MNTDDKGFEYPVVNDKLCIDCGLCVKTCPIIQSNKSDNNLFEQEVYAVVNSDYDIRKKSTSGGAFSLIADYVLQNGGIVYGATLDDNLNIRHIAVDDVNQLDKILGSKYVQSSIGTTFSEIKSLLEDGRLVLFCGTPCQVDGLQKFIPSKLKHSLITVDFVCHGVPSPKIWKDYADYLQKKYSLKLTDYKFRPKIAGWHIHIENAEFENGKKVYNTQCTNIWSELFHKNLTLRPHCFKCEYTNYERVSDITVGDFWGIENSDAKVLDDNQGVSLVLINTQKGKDVFNIISKKSVFAKSTKQQCKQRALFTDAVCKYDNELFWSEYLNHGFEYVANKYAHTNIRRLIKVHIMIFMQKLGVFKMVYKLMHK